MKKQQLDRCPGCSKHCCADHPRCKYGRKYFKETPAKPKYKWDPFTSVDSPVWNLFFVSRRLKKQVCKSKVSEEQLLNRLSKDEQTALSLLLKKLLQNDASMI